MSQQIGGLCDTSVLKTHSVPATMVKAEAQIWARKGNVIILSVALRGGRDITSWSTGSTPRLHRLLSQSVPLDTLAAELAVLNLLMRYHDHI